MTDLPATPGPVPRVLFVDDEPHVLAALRRSLASWRRVWAMEFVDSGPAALAVLELRCFQVVASDFRMPGMDGGELLERVRERFPLTARLMLSGHTDREDLREALTVTHHFLDKPCTRRALVQAIQDGLWLHDELVAELGR